MTEPTEDSWAGWVLRELARKDGRRHSSESGFLREFRDGVLSNAAPKEGETLLDVGAGDGLIAFGALDLVGEGGRVVFSDVSRDLLTTAGGSSSGWASRGGASS